MTTNPIETFESRLAATGNRPSGFDYMRLMLCIIVISVHSLKVTDTALSDALWHGPFRPLVALVVPMFFCMSGFLISGSFMRCQTLISFGGLRALRLLPALTVCVLLAAFVLGPIFTSLPLSEYFRQRQFFDYFLNIFGRLHFGLPGVFLNNPDRNDVSIQLWTLTYEMSSYIVLMALSVIGVIARPRLFVPLLIAGNIVAVAGCVLFPSGAINILVPGHILVICFLFGMAAFMFKDQIIWDQRLMLISLAIVLACLATRNVGDTLMPIPVAYLTVYLGLLQPRRSAVINSGDYSYGIFLYGYPVQQMVAAIFGRHQFWFTNLIVALPVTLLLAVLSWRFVEKPALRWKAFILTLEERSVHLSADLPWMRYLRPALRKP